VPVEARRGRPPKVDDAGVATRQRLLAAAIAACVEHGYEGVTVNDVAARAEVSAPAIYHHFGGKDELLVAAGRWALDRLRPEDGASLSAPDVVSAFLAPSFADSRCLMIELHLAGRRHPEIAAMMAEWHADHAPSWRRRAAGTPAQRDAAVTTFFALLLGLCQFDSLALPATRAAVERRSRRIAADLFPTER